MRPCSRPLYIIQFFSPALSPFSLSASCASIIIRAWNSGHQFPGRVLRETFSWLKGIKLVRQVSRSAKRRLRKAVLRLRDDEYIWAREPQKRNFTPWELIGSGCKYLKTASWEKIPTAELFACIGRDNFLWNLPVCHKKQTTSWCSSYNWNFSLGSPPFRRGNFTN